MAEDRRQAEWLALSRRELLQRVGCGMGAFALTSLLNPAILRGGDAARAGGGLHLPARAKRLIYVHLVGAPSQFELFENKPALVRHDGQPVPAELIEGQRFAFLRGHPKLLGTKFPFRRCGESGLELSDRLPHLAGVADELAIIKTLQTEEFNHAPAQLFMQTGFGQFGRPSLGAWMSYGLGSENEDLPAFVVLVTGATAGAGNSLWGSGFLPTSHQGIQFRTSGDPVLFLSNPPGVQQSDRRRMLDEVQAFNRAQLADVGDPEIATRIAQYEMAFRMQTSVPELMDLASEPESVHRLYGSKPGQGSFANNCLLARRLVERGVRVVQLYDEGWDHHGSIFSGLPKKARQVDQPIAALITDLKQRGLLDETLVVWSAEFGRTPMMQDDREKAGRDHHKEAFCVWMAGGGVKGGTTVGKTDELGYYPVEDPLHVRDFHATILHLMGVDHRRLTFKYQGRQFRLTDIGGEVIQQAIA